VCTYEREKEGVHVILISIAPIITPRHVLANGEKDFASIAVSEVVSVLFRNANEVVGVGECCCHCERCRGTGGGCQNNKNDRKEEISRRT